MQTADLSRPNRDVLEALGLDPATMLDASQLNEVMDAVRALSRPMPSREEVARLIAETAVGFRIEDLMRNKAEWIDLRGEKNGYARDVNDPFQSDIYEAADAIRSLFSSSLGGDLFAENAKKSGAEQIAENANCSLPPHHEGGR